MSDKEETIWIVFNGEIYNFPELKRELEALGHVFRTKSDTEVIIHGYKQWGDDVLNHLNGMFGLAIWDRRTKAPRRCSRSLRNQADLLQDRSGPLLLWFGDSRGCSRHRRESRTGPGIDESFPPLSIYAVALHNVQGHSQARSRNDAGMREGPLRGCDAGTTISQLLFLR